MTAQETESTTTHRVRVPPANRGLGRGLLGRASDTAIRLLRLTRLNYLIALAARRASLDCPTLVRLDVPITGLPPALDGLRIGHLTDLHLGPYFRPEQARPAVDLLRAAAPDLIAMTGDLIDERRRELVPAAQLMAGLSAPLGVYGVLGNHDHRPGGARLLAALAEHAPQVHILVNDACRVPLPTAELWVAGIDSIYLGLADPEAALAPVPPSAACLFLTHEPDAADYLPRPVTLSLAGHAHGGQIRLGGRPLLLPPLGRQYHGGLNQSRTSPIYTGRGVGWTGLPLRLGCPPEVALLRLVAAER